MIINNKLYLNKCRIYEYSMFYESNTSRRLREKLPVKINSTMQYYLLEDLEDILIPEYYIALKKIVDDDWISEEFKNTWFKEFMKCTPEEVYNFVNNPVDKRLDLIL